MPYHALNHAERETFNARRRLLAHVGDILREKAVVRERTRLAEEEQAGRRSMKCSLLSLRTQMFLSSFYCSVEY